MRESLARVLSGISNLDEGPHERPVDRLHALASAQIVRADRAARASHLASLGVSLIALKDANRPDEYLRAVDKLTSLMRDMRPRASHEARTKLSRWAIQECVISFCPRCRGTGEVPASNDVEGAQRMVPCPPRDYRAPENGGCGGTGKRRYSDAERLEALEVDREQLAALTRQLDYAHLLLAQAESEAIRSAQVLLERWKK